MMGSPTHLGSETEPESESDISDTTQNVNRAQPEGGSVRVRERRQKNPPSDEENNSVRAEECEEERIPESEFLNIESEGGEVGKDALDGTSERFPSQNPRATKFTVQGGPASVDIETEVHTSNHSHPSRSEASSSAFEARTKGDTSNTAKSSQKDLDQDIRTHSPQGISPPHTHDAFVAHDILDHPFDQERPKISLLPEKNIKPPPKEGPSELEGNLESCVDPKVTPSDYVTKEEFKIFGYEVRESLKEIKLKMEKTSEASASRSEVAKLTSEVFELRTTVLSQNAKLDALESLVIKNDSVLSREIVNSKTELLKAIPTPCAPTPSTADFSLFKEEVLRSLAEVIGKIPTSSASAPATSDFVTKADLTNFSKKITSNVMNISSKFVSKTTQQNKKIEDLLKNVKSSEGSLKRKEPEVACSEEARKKARYEDSDDHDDQPQGSLDLHKGEKTPTPRTVETQKESTPSETNQGKEKETEIRSTSTSAEDNQATLKSLVPVVFLASSTSGAPVIPIIDATLETIGALEEDEDEQLSEEEQKANSERTKEAAGDQIEVIDVDEYGFKNAQPHHTSTTTELRDSPEIDGYISEPTQEDPPQTTEPETMVANEQAPSENPVQKANIGLPAKEFSQPPTFLASNLEASIEDHFRYIYCEFSLSETLVIPLNPRIREDMPDYERRFVRDKTRPRAQVLSDDPIIKINKISEKTFAYNKLVYRHYVVTRYDQKIYEFNDNDLVNLNPYDLPHLYAYCSARAKRDFQIALNLGEEKVEVTEPVESIDKLEE
ncbi:hypothetical protein L6452_01961 [Arctium lappa]|uniref:Uncharacterized protein n=1 Tax=Arctium lappa TaxID=4217 RepID=A0ACB9FJD7_ARCLA|nr:hypothetical protein L6452_01961 [Arctium lappa]